MEVYFMPNTNDKKTCFIITPIGSTGSAIRRKTDGIIEEVIEPILDELGYKIVVSHRIDESGSVTNAIIRGVYESDLVIANLTGNNPNVMYEVALRHASAKPIIHIAENVTDLPFDINDQRTIEYTDDMAGACKLKDDLKKQIQNIRYDEIVENPVTHALEKKNLVNIPETASKDLSDMLYQMLDNVKQIKNEMKVVKEFKNEVPRKKKSREQIEEEQMYNLFDIVDEELPFN